MKYLITYLKASLPILLLSLASCAKHEKKKEELTFNELKDKSLHALKKKQSGYAIDYLEEMVTRFADSPHLSSYKLMLADLYYKQERFAESYELYNSFSEMYPSDKKAEYATYRALVSKYNQTLQHDCDSTQTEETIQLCKNYFQNHRYLHYYKDVLAIEKTCVQKLIDKEVYVFNFYLHQGKLQSAQNRLNYLKDNFLKTNPDIEPQLLYLEGKLAKYNNEKDIVDEKVALLINNFPKSPYAKMARSLVQQNTFTF